MLGRQSAALRAIRRLRYRALAKGLVLAYHRVADLEQDPFSMAVSEARFAEQLGSLAEHARCVSLDVFVEEWHAGSLTPETVAITFDDGYADNFSCALPLLERFGIPATVFVTSDFLGSRQEAWWDRLEQVVLGSAALPARGEVTIGQASISWQWSSDAEETGGRRALLDALHRALSGLDTDAKEEALTGLWQMIGIEPRLRSSHRMMTEDDVKALAGHPLMTIGAHTRTHPELPGLGPERQADEIASGKARLETVIGAPVKLFSYPHRVRNALTLRTVRQARFSAAFTTDHRPVTGYCDRFEMPRVVVEDVGGDRLLESLTAFGFRPRMAGRVPAAV